MRKLSVQVVLMNKPVITAVLPRVLLIILIQTVLLIVMIAGRQAILDSDTTVILETEPIDPRSLFRGDYVRLNYTINELNLAELAGDKDFQRNETVYVVLQPEDDFWTAVAVYRQLPVNAGHKKPLTVIRGVVKHQIKRGKTEDLSVTYGIENYFVPEGEGLKLERPQEGDKVTLEIALDDKGKAAIKALLVNGVRQYEETLF